MAFDLVARLRLIDNMTAPARRAMSSMASMATKISGVSAAVGVLTSGLGSAAIATKSLSKALDFEAQMSTIKALTGATSTQMKQMEDLALTMGSKTKYSALQAAQGIEELLKAGISPAAVQSGALEAALNLATAGGLELASAAEIMSTALNAYKKDGLTAAEASNILAGTANASATGVEDLRMSLSAVSAVAAGFGMTFKDTNAAMGLFANNGFKGSDAGTSLKTMLQNLQPGTKEQIALFNKLGITTNGTANKFFDASGKIQDLANVANTLRKALGGMNNMQRQAALEAMFGTDAIRAANILYEEGADGVKKFYDEMGNVTALQVATEKMNNGKGAIEQFKGAVETLQIRAFKPLLPAVKQTFNALGDYVTNKTPQITAAMQRMVDGAKRYLNEHFINNPEFKSLPDTKSKITFIFDDLLAAFNRWYQQTGAGMVNTATATLVDNLARVLSDNAGKLADPAIKLGATIASGIASGLRDSLANHPILGGMVAGAAAPVPLPMKATVGAGTLVTGNMMKSFDNYKKMFTSGEIEGLSDLKAVFGFPDGSHRSGLSNVPFDGYRAELHRGERVLTASENDSYSRGNGGGIMVTGNTFHVRQESDIQAIAAELAREIRAAREAGVR
jgi:TP901 family phage tail tape measure protein